MNKLKIQTYEDIRESGATNMFDLKTVVELSHTVLDRADCLDIMQNYEKYIKLFNVK